MAIVPDIQSKITDVDFSVTVIVAVMMMMSSDYLLFVLFSHGL